MKNFWTREYWIKLYYKLRYNINSDHIGASNSSMYPDTRDISEFKSVKCKGHYIDITDKATGDFVRIIPYVLNHGIMVETWEGGKLNNRNILKYEQLRNDWMYSYNVEAEGIKRDVTWKERFK
jgi:hypothetical protein